MERITETLLVSCDKLRWDAVQLTIVVLALLMGGLDRVAFVGHRAH